MCDGPSPRRLPVSCLSDHEADSELSWNHEVAVRSHGVAAEEGDTASGRVGGHPTAGESPW